MIRSSENELEDISRVNRLYNAQEEGKRKAGQKPKETLATKVQRLTGSLEKDTRNKLREGAEKEHNLVRDTEEYQTVLRNMTRQRERVEQAKSGGPFEAIHKETLKILTEKAAALKGRLPKKVGKNLENKEKKGETL